MRLSRIINEILILPDFLSANKKLKKKEKITYKKLPSEYKSLAKKHLLERIKEEHKRVEDIIEKTYKILTFSGVFFTIISLSWLDTVNFGIQIILLYYAVIMVFLGIYSLSTYQKYGYGTYFKFLSLKRKSQEIIANNLYQMEILCISKSNINSICFMCLRNIVIILTIYYLYSKLLALLNQHTITPLQNYISDFLC